MPPSTLLDYDDAVAFNMGLFWLGLKIDGFAASNSKYPWTSWSDWGWKAVTSCISDLVAKGFRPLIVMYSVGTEDPGTIQDIASGIIDAIEYYGIEFGGADTNKCEGDSWIDVACIGVSEKPPIPRFSDKVRVGNAVIITGFYGLQGVAMYSHYKLRKEPELPDVIEVTKRPRARIEILGIISKYRDYIYASIDVSDGLAETLYQLIEGKDVGIELSNIPIHPAAIEYAEAYGLDPLHLAMYGGEEYELVMVVDESMAQKMVNEMKSLNIPAVIAGFIINKQGVFVRGELVKRCGWDHFTEPILGNYQRRNQY